MKTIRQRKDPYAGKTWIRDNHMEALRKGESIRVIHKGQFAGEMILTKDDLPALELNKSAKMFMSKYDGSQYHAYGIFWRPKDAEGNLLYPQKPRKVEEKKPEPVDKHPSLFS